MKKLFISVAVILLSFNVAKAQEEKESQFIVMSSGGYMNSDFVQGMGYVNTFLYCPSKLWAYGLDLGFSQGSDIIDRKSSASEFYEKTDISKIFFNPSIYLTPLNTSKHQIYIGISVGIGYTDYTTIGEQKNPGLGVSHEKTEYWLDRNEFGVAIGANAGYNYKFAENWMVGARLYYNHNLESTMMGLATIGIRF